MKTTVTKTNFRDSFFNAGRKDQFSYDGLGALFDWIEQYEEDCDTEMELDVVALCCDFSEYESALDCVKDCGYNVPEIDTCPFCGEGVLSDDETCPDCEQDIAEEMALDYLQENTMVIEFEGGIIIQAF